MEQNNNKSCLLAGYFGHHNLGDDLLFQEALKVIPEDTTIYIQSNAPYIDELKKDRNYTVLPDMKSVLQHRFNLIYWGGGGVFPSLKFGLKGLIRLLLIMSRGHRKVVSGVGIVPKKGYTSNLFFSLFLKCLDYISVRDEVSRNYAQSLLSKKHNVINSGDLFFGRERIKYNEMRKGCLVCLANPFSDKEKSDDKNVAARYKLLVEVLQNCCCYIQRRGVKVTFLPFYENSDIKLINDVMTHPSLSSSKVLKIGEDFTLDTIDSVFQKYEIGLNMRFHSFVLSVRNNLPFTGICYDYKSESLLQECGLADCGLRYGIRETEFFGCVNDITEDELKAKIDLVISKSESISNTMEQMATKLHTKVVNNYRNIFETIK